MAYNFFAILFRQKYIERWSLMRNVTPDTLAAHSAEVAAVTHMLALIGNKYFGKNYDCGRAVLLALYHDSSEVYTGDMPTPVKYFNSGMREAYSEIERNAGRVLLSKLPDEMRCEYAQLIAQEGTEADAELFPLVKAADKLCAYIKCIEEEKCGNYEFREARKTLYSTLLSNPLPELHRFMEDYLPAFELTVDEL
jgi:5'-deoxynucleotidase